MAEFNFYLKDPKSKGKTAVVLSIASQNERSKFYTGKKVNPKFWCNDPENKERYQRTIRSSDFREAPEFNTDLDNYEIEAKKIAHRLSSEFDRVPTALEIKKALELKFRPELVKQVKEIELFDYWKDTAENIIYRTNSKTKKPITRHTRISLLQTLRILRKFSSQKKKVLRWDNIDLNFYEGFKKYLEAELILSGNTVAKHIANIKFMMADATEHGIITNQDFRNKKFRATKEEPNAIYLNESELEELEKLDLSKRPALANVRDLFLIGCWTGLRFSDYSELSRAIFETNFIEIETKKNRKNIVIPILPPLTRILEKYKTKNGLDLPRCITNQKMNDALKEIARMLPSLHSDFSITTTKGGMEVTVKSKKWELVVTHTARRSFATNMYLNDFPAKLIMDITGHSTDKQFYHYIKMTPKQSAEKLRDMWINKKSSQLKVAK